MARTMAAAAPLDPDTVRAHFMLRSLPLLLGAILLSAALAAFAPRSMATGCAGTPLMVGALSLPELALPA